MSDAPPTGDSTSPTPGDRGTHAHLVPGPAQDAAADNPGAVVAEVMPGVVAVFGDLPERLPEGLAFEALDLGLVPTHHRNAISNLVGAVANTATVAGNLSEGLAKLNGIYRITDATQALLDSGGRLATKDGANLGTVLTENGFAQARFVPLTRLSAAKTAAAVGPAVASMALQMTLSEITSLARANNELTGTVLTTIRQGEWDQLTALVSTVDNALEDARAIGAVPGSLWDTVSGRRTELRTVRQRYRRHVGEHVTKLQTLNAAARREYLQQNAETIFFDTQALLSSLKAWVGYQTLHAAHAGAAGALDPHEARLVERILARTRSELDSALPEAATLTSSLTRELRILTELPDQDVLRLPGRRREQRQARDTSLRLLQAITPLADAINPPVPTPVAPPVSCVPPTTDLGPFLKILGWYLRSGERLEAVVLADQRGDRHALTALVGMARDKIPNAQASTPGTLVALTDQRIMTADAGNFLARADLGPDTPLDLVRYVRVRPAATDAGRVEVDLTTRDHDTSWAMPAGTDPIQVSAFAGLLAAAMHLPETERDRLVAGTGPGPSQPPALETREHDPVA
jgi:hypothetical protein